MKPGHRNPQHSGRWWELHYPFRHFRATDVLAEHDLRTVSTAFRGVLDECSGPNRMRRGTPNYDALMLAVTNELAPKFPPFFSEPWIRELHDFFDLPYLGRIDGALHSNPKGSRTGWIHTDYCSAWFDESGESGGGLTFPNRARCDYFDGRPKVEDAKPAEYVRAVTLVFYCCNEDWQPGDGGETGLYPAASDTSNSPHDLVRPLNNTLLCFECSPHSYHRFLTNPGRTRNSLIMWLHCTVEHAEARWGTRSINRRRHKQ